MGIWGRLNRPVDVSEDVIRERVHETERLAERRAAEDEAEHDPLRKPPWWRRLFRRSSSSR